METKSTVFPKEILQVEPTTQKSQTLINPPLKARASQGIFDICTDRALAEKLLPKMYASSCAVSFDILRVSI